jgi:hypothetical protein
MQASGATTMASGNFNAPKSRLHFEHCERAEGAKELSRGWSAAKPWVCTPRHPALKKLKEIVQATLLQTISPTTIPAWTRARRHIYLSCFRANRILNSVVNTARVGELPAPVTFLSIELISSTFGLLLKVSLAAWGFTLNLPPFRATHFLRRILPGLKTRGLSPIAPFRGCMSRHV